MSDNSYQLNIFNFDKQHYKITKPIRLIELFAGIGAQAKALEVLGVKFEHYKICEWAVNSIKAYNAIHTKDFTDYSVGKTKNELIEYLQGNISVDYNAPCDVSRKNEVWLRETYNNCIATHNLMNIMKTHGKDLEIVDTDKYEYVMTYSFPCQDLSLAGNGKGMATSQAQGGTRSGLLWEVERILDEVENKPQILLMENVPEVMGQKNVKHFNKWLAKLESLGYSNFFQILNSKNYGIPQNRRRCFMVSVLGDYAYDFPLKIKLEYRLKDFLEKQVDEKYFLSDKMLQFLNDETNRNGFIRKKHSRPTDNFIEVFDFRYDEGIRGRVDNDLSPTITTKVGSKALSGQPFIKVPQATKQGYAIGVVVEDNRKIYNPLKDKTPYGWHFEQEVYLDKGSVRTIKAGGGSGNIPKVLVNDDNINVLDKETENNLRIRKLTPKECWRLMGFDDKDYLALVEIGLSNSAIYHCAGDSIVTTCLMGLFGKMLLNEKEVKNKIEEYVETIKEQF